MSSKIEEKFLLPPISRVAPSRNEGLCGRIMRVGMFEMASAREGLIEQFLFNSHWNQINHVSCCSKVGTFDPQRCIKSEELLLSLGGERFSFIPRDEEALVHGMFIDSRSVVKKIAEMGAVWKKIEHDGKSYFAIIPQRTDGEWHSFVDQILHRMDWKEASWDPDIIITAEDVGGARDIQENKHCVMLVDITVPIGMQRREIARFVGLGCSVVMVNARGLVTDPNQVWEDRGVITEASCYEDLGCVLQYLEQQKQIPKSQVIVRGNCLNAAIGVHLVAQYAQEGLSAFLDNVPLSPREILTGHPCLLKFYDAYIRSTQSLPTSSLRDLGIEENGFNSMESIEKMAVFSKNFASKILCVGMKGDFATPPEKVELVVQQFKQKLPQENCIFYCQQMSEIPGGEKLGAHMASSIRNRYVREIFFRHFGMIA